MWDIFLAMGCVKSEAAIDDRGQCLDCQNFPQWANAKKCLAGEMFWDLNLKIRCTSFQKNEKNNFWD
jgi:hypothetical protein